MCGEIDLSAVPCAIFFFPISCRQVPLLVRASLNEVVRRLKSCEFRSYLAVASVGEGAQIHVVPSVSEKWIHPAA